MATADAAPTSRVIDSAGVVHCYTAAAELVRREYLRRHVDHGRVEHYSRRRVTRVEFVEGHRLRGMVQTYDEETGALVRIVFGHGHKRHGEVLEWEAGKYVRTRFEAPHMYMGIVHMYEDGEHVRTLYESPHELAKHGTIHYIERKSGKVQYTEFTVPEWRRGVYYHRDATQRTTHITFGAAHRNSGLIMYKEVASAALLRIEYEPHHRKHGEIDHIVHNAHVRKEFAPDHAEHGKVILFRDGKVAEVRLTEPYRMKKAGLEQWLERPELVCPITLCAFTDPVVASDGHTYERSALALVLKSDDPRSPMTREPLRHDVVIPNVALRKHLTSHMATTLAIAAHVAARAAVATTCGCRKRARGDA